MGTKRLVRIVSIHDDRGNWVECGGARFSTLYFGQSHAPSAPVAIFVRAGRDVGDRIGGARTYDTPVLIVVIEGTLELDGRWFRVGEMQVVESAVAHGDLVIGPEGATFMILFAKRAGMVPTFIDKEDQQCFDASLRSAVERVAKGEVEESVAVLPPRSMFRPRRGITVTDPTEIAPWSAEPEHEPGERPGILVTRVDDDSLPWGPPLLNARSTIIVLGDPSDPEATAVGVINTRSGPGDGLRGRHFHRSDAVNLVIEGGLYMDGAWLRAGEAKVVAAEQEYGDGLAGPDGVKFLEIWAEQSGAEPEYCEQQDRAYFEALKRGGHLRERRSVK
jgi:hypothetical protein